MKNLKHKFIIIVLCIIIGILALQIFMSLRENDRNSYITLIEGTGKINNISLELQKKYQISVGDILSTGQKGLVVIEWGDGSITRMSQDSQLRIKENLISQNLSQIQIATQMIQGKSWSKVTTNLAGESYFKVYFNNIEAGVRGTTFDIDVEKEVIFVQDHEVTLKKGDLPPFRLGENQPFSLAFFRLIDLQEYLQKFQDLDWKSLNTKLDGEYRKKRVEEAMDLFSKNQPFLIFLEIFFPKYRILAELHGNQDEKKIETLITSLSPDQKQEVYEVVYEEYQSINFVSPNEGDIYTKKLAYKKAIILLTQDISVQKSIVKGSIYDFQDSISAQNIAGFQKTIAFLGEQKDIINELPQEAKNFLNVESIQMLSPSFKAVLLENTKIFQDIFQIDVTKIDFSLEGVQSLNDVAKGLIESGLDKAFDSILNK